MKTLRIDDVSINTDQDSLGYLVEQVLERYEGVEVLLAVSPMVFQPREEDPKKRQRVFPSIHNALSDKSVNYFVERCGVPGIAFELAGRYGNRIRLAGHGIVHTDHRLMSRGAQELSILTSVSLVGSKVFVPPFHKWDSNTEGVCCQHGIELIKFEDGWQHLSFTGKVGGYDRIYTHMHDHNMKEFMDLLDLNGSY